MDTNTSPQETLQRLLQADQEAQERVQQAEEKANALLKQVREEAHSLVEQAREAAQAEARAIVQTAATGAPTAPEQTAATDTDQAYRTDPQALRQRAEPRIQDAAGRLAAWVAGEDL